MSRFLFLEWYVFSLIVKGGPIKLKNPPFRMSQTHLVKKKWKDMTEDEKEYIRGLRKEISGRFMQALKTMPTPLILIFRYVLIMFTLFHHRYP